MFANHVQAIYSPCKVCSDCNQKAFPSHVAFVPSHRRNVGMYDQQWCTTEKLSCWAWVRSYHLSLKETTNHILLCVRDLVNAIRCYLWQVGQADNWQTKTARKFASLIEVMTVDLAYRKHTMDIQYIRYVQDNCMYRTYSTCVFTFIVMQCFAGSKRDGHTVPRCPVCPRCGSVWRPLCACILWQTWAPKPCHQQRQLPGLHGSQPWGNASSSESRALQSTSYVAWDAEAVLLGTL